jgi:phenylpyruvate tautomerase PptA (4-oxalocrotonate tautomerase family)
MKILNALKKVLSASKEEVTSAIKSLSANDLTNLIKTVLGLPSETVHLVLENLSEEDKKQLVVLFQELVKAVVAGAIEGAVDSSK